MDPYSGDNYHDSRGLGGVHYLEINLSYDPFLHLNEEINYKEGLNSSHYMFISKFMKFVLPFKLLFLVLVI